MKSQILLIIQVIFSLHNGLISQRHAAHAVKPLPVKAVRWCMAALLLHLFVFPAFAQAQAVAIQPPAEAMSSLSPNTSGQKIIVWGRNNSNSHKATIIGMAVGAATLGTAFVIINKLDKGACEGSDCKTKVLSDSGAFLLGGLIGLIPGGVVGTLIGSSHRKSQPVDMDFGLQPAPQSDYFPGASGRLHPSLTLRWSLTSKR